MKKFIIFSVLIIFSSLILFSQENGKISPRLDFTYLKKNDGSRLLTANLYTVKNRITYPVHSTSLIFEVGTLKAEIKTNSKGIAYLIVDKDTRIELNSEGFMRFTVHFNGSDTLDIIDSELLVKDAFLNLSLEEIDSVRSVKVQLRELTTKGDTVPVSGQILNIYVPRMISLLKIGEETTDDDGMISLEFPNDLPGNSDSTITIVARLDENELYANVEVKKVTRWGIPIIHRIPESHRALWTEIAPVWMIVTLSVMLAGVWGHYIFVLIQLFLIKRESKKQKV